MNKAKALASVAFIAMAGPVKASEAPPADPAFFEFLASMVDVDGEWIDPMTLAEPDELSTNTLDRPEKTSVTTDEDTTP